MEFKDSKTYQNLLTAYNVELKSSTKYEIYGDIARREGYIEIANIYDFTSKNDKEHARIWFRRMNEGKLPTTAETLLESTAEEYNVANGMYQEFASTAKDEGYNDIAALFSGVANIDYNHSFEFRTLSEDMQKNEIFCKPEERLWICMQCGNIMSGKCAPEICPVCGFPQGFYRLLE